MESAANNKSDVTMESAANNKKINTLTSSSSTSASSSPSTLSDSHCPFQQRQHQHQQQQQHRTTDSVPEKTPSTPLRSSPKQSKKNLLRTRYNSYQQHVIGNTPQRTNNSNNWSGSQNSFVDCAQGVSFDDSFHSIHSHSSYVSDFSSSFQAANHQQQHQTKKQTTTIGQPANPKFISVKTTKKSLAARIVNGPKPPPSNAKKNKATSMLLAKTTTSDPVEEDFTTNVDLTPFVLPSTVSISQLNTTEAPCPVCDTPVNIKQDSRIERGNIAQFIVGVENPIQCPITDQIIDPIAAAGKSPVSKKEEAEDDLIKSTPIVDQLSTSRISSTHYRVDSTFDILAKVSEANNECNEQVVVWDDTYEDEATINLAKSFAEADTPIVEHHLSIATCRTAVKEYDKQAREHDSQAEVTLLLQLKEDLTKQLRAHQDDNNDLRYKNTILQNNMEECQKTISHLEEKARHSIIKENALEDTILILKKQLGETHSSTTKLIEENHDRINALQIEVQSKAELCDELNAKISSFEDASYEASRSTDLPEQHLEKFKRTIALLELQLMSLETLRVESAPVISVNQQDLENPRYSIPNDVICQLQTQLAHLQEEHDNELQKLVSLLEEQIARFLSVESQLKQSESERESMAADLDRARELFSIVEEKDALQRSLNECQESLSITERVINSLRTDHEAAGAKHAEVVAGLKLQVENLESNLRKQSNESIADVLRLETERDELNREAEALRSALKLSEDTVNKVSTSFHDLEVGYRVLACDHDALKQNHKVAVDMALSLEDEFAKIKEKYDVEIASKDRSLLALMSENETLKAEALSSSDCLAASIERVNKTEKELLEQRELFHTLTQERDELIVERDDMLVELALIGRKLSIAESEVDESKKEIEQLFSDKNKLEEELHALQDECVTLRERTSDLEHSQNESVSLEEENQNLLLTIHANTEQIKEMEEMLESEKIAASRIEAKYRLEEERRESQLAEISTLKQEHEKCRIELESRLETTSALLFEKEKLLDECTKNLTIYMNQNTSLTQEMSVYSAKLTELEVSLQECRKKEALQEEMLVSLRCDCDELKSRLQLTTEQMDVKAQEHLLELENLKRSKENLQLVNQKILARLKVLQDECVTLGDHVKDLEHCQNDSVRLEKENQSLLLTIDTNNIRINEMEEMLKGQKVATSKMETAFKVKEEQFISELAELSTHSKEKEMYALEIESCLALTKDLLSQKEKLLDECTNTLESYKNESASLTDKICSKEAQVTNLEASLRESREKDAKDNETIISLRHACDDLKTQLQMLIVKMEAQTQEHFVELENMKLNEGKLVSQIEEKHMYVSGLEEQMEHLRLELQKTRDACLEEVTMTRTQIVQLTAGLEELNTILSEKEKESDRLVKELLDVRSENTCLRQIPVDSLELKTVNQALSLVRTEQEHVDAMKSLMEQRDIIKKQFDCILLG